MRSLLKGSPFPNCLLVDMLTDSMRSSINPCPHTRAQRCTCASSPSHTLIRPIQPRRYTLLCMCVQRVHARSHNALRRARAQSHSHSRPVSEQNSGGASPACPSLDTLARSSSLSLQDMDVIQVLLPAWRPWWALKKRNRHTGSVSAYFSFKHCKQF